MKKGTAAAGGKKTTAVAGKKPVGKGPVQKKADALFPSRPRNFGIGGNVQPVRDLTRYVRWPRYIRVQRQKKVLTTRLKVPPTVNQFKNALDRNQAAEVFRLLAKYSPESKADKQARLRAVAEAKAAGKDATSKAPTVLKFGLGHVTTLIEQKKAKFVAIASDVDPIELVLWLPALCRKMDVPYVIVKNKGRLGTLVHQKKAAVVALTDVRGEDKAKLDTLREVARTQYNTNTDALRRWGGGQMGLKTTRKLEKRDKALREEAAKKAMF